MSKVFLNAYDEIQQQMVILHPDETISFVYFDEENSYEYISDAVDGGIELCFGLSIPVANKKEGKEALLPIVAFCNDEFLISNDKQFDKINALASLISNKEIRGNVAVLYDKQNGDSRGFVGCEKEIIKKFVEHTREMFKDEIKMLHKEFDNNKSEPKFVIFYGD